MADRHDGHQPLLLTFSLALPAIFNPSRFDILAIKTEGLGPSANA